MFLSNRRHRQRAPGCPLKVAGGKRRGHIHGKRQRGKRLLTQLVPSAAKPCSPTRQISNRVHRLASIRQPYVVAEYQVFIAPHRYSNLNRINEFFSQDIVSESRGLLVKINQQQG